MKSLFLLFTAILLLVFIKVKETKKETLELVSFEKTTTLEYSGKLFIPRSIRLTSDEKVDNILLTVGDKLFKYNRLFTDSNSFYLTGDAFEMEIDKGIVINTNLTQEITLFFAKEV